MRTPTANWKSKDLLNDTTSPTFGGKVGVSVAPAQRAPSPSVSTLVYVTMPTFPRFAKPMTSFSHAYHVSLMLNCQHTHTQTILGYSQQLSEITVSLFFPRFCLYVFCSTVTIGYTGFPRNLPGNLRELLRSKSFTGCSPSWHPSKWPNHRNQRTESMRMHFKKFINKKNTRLNYGTKPMMKGMVSKIMTTTSNKHYRIRQVSK